MAAAWRLPVVFVCENNYYGVSTRLDRVSPTTELTRRAAGYAIETAPWMATTCSRCATRRGRGRPARPW